MKCPECAVPCAVGYAGPVCRECRIFWVDASDGPEYWTVRAL